MSETTVKKAKSQEEIAAEKAAKVETAQEEAAAKAAEGEEAKSTAQNHEDGEVSDSSAVSFADSQAGADARLEVQKEAETAKAGREGKAAKIATESLEGKLCMQGISILKDYPEANEINMTSNGFGFFDFNDAKNHASTLTDKTVVTVKKEDK